MCSSTSTPSVCQPDQGVDSEAVSQVMCPRVHRGGADAEGGGDLRRVLSTPLRVQPGADAGDEERRRRAGRGQSRSRSAA